MICRGGPAVLAIVIRFLHPGIFANNGLRLIGQRGLTGESPPSVIRPSAARFILTDGQRILDFGRTCPVVAVFRAVQEDMLTAGCSP